MSESARLPLGLGATVEPDGVRFRVWAAGAERVTVAIEDGGEHPLRLEPDALATAFVPGLGAGARYRFKLDGQGPFPDPASRFQPLGVHGPSEVVDPAAFAWSDGAWRGLEPETLVLYELHVGTFSPAGTFAGVRERLPHLRELGVTALELMPVADFPGQRNWGYDGVAPFAPARCYGTPDELRAMVDAAHGLGLGVLLDVVYNHLGPDGNYLHSYSPAFFSDRHQTPWGQAINLDGPGSALVRAFLIENALRWLAEYHFDGLRLDATHALVDESPRHFLAELAERVLALPGPRRLLVAEDERNLAGLVRRAEQGGMALDAVWADDFHHQMRRRLAGDHDGYFADFSGSTADIVDTVTHGFHYRGRMVARTGHPRGSDTTGVPRHRFVFCIQNHDQIGNRALGERLHHQIEPAAYRAATALLLLTPATPLLFMGQEWAASTPFLYFTDHHPELGKLVTRGRREEFKGFAAFSSPDARERIPDPQSEQTFARSRLCWEELAQPPYVQVLVLYRALLELRRRIGPTGLAELSPHAHEPAALLLTSGQWQIVIALAGPADVVLPTAPGELAVVLDTEEPRFTADARRPRLVRAGDTNAVVFSRPGALVLRRLSHKEQP